MATIVLSAVGAAAGASVGGGVLGLSSVVIGRAVGASVGRAIDERLLGGSQPVDGARIDRFRLSAAGEGGRIAQVFGRMRVPGQVIWASRFREEAVKTGGGKGSPAPKTTTYSYSVSLAIALCEGEITRVGRIWADGQEIAAADLNLRVYKGTADQLPDAKIEAVEGAGRVPGYRGLAYVVLEDLALEAFGNRVPQFSFEVMRPAQAPAPEAASDPAHGIRGVALIPGSGEYALATTPVYMKSGPGQRRAANIHSPSGRTDFATSIEALNGELPNCGSASLVVSWFGDDLRCDRTSLRPKVEQAAIDGAGMPWRVSGLDRAGASLVPQLDGRPVYGGTPTDQSVIEAITELKARGKSVVFYPFVLMDQLAGNGLTDPWSGGPDQPALPWRGRITLSAAPGQAGSPDQTAAADAEVAAFFGTAQAADFQSAGDTVLYSGPNEWSYRRFVLHYAHLCALAGGVDAFCIGSEMRGLTQVRGQNGFAAVTALIQLAADVRTVLGPAAKIGYAADWSEYFGFQPQDGSGDVFFHLDPLWADANIDFIGIDNYMPLSDWREGDAHADAHWGSIYDTGYLKSNIEGGEGYDWYYASPEAAEHQIRTPITDGAHGEAWVFRYKDIRNWWSRPHHERIGGVRSAQPTAWVPEAKPIWFTEFGCAAIDKGTNQPNRFLDGRSSESGLPRYSDGRRDELIQMQYLRAMFEYWDAAANNPVSSVYGGAMVDMTRAHVWAWDTRPFPHFPHLSDTWSDAANYPRGHWINGRSSARALADVVREICARSGVGDVDVSGLFGHLRGYVAHGVTTAREALQPLLAAFGVEVAERDGVLVFRNRGGGVALHLDQDGLAWLSDQESPVQRLRAPEAEVAGRMRVGFVDAEGDYDARIEEASFPDEEARGVADAELPVLLTRAEGRAVAERWLAEARIGRDGLSFALPPSQALVGAGDVVSIDEAGRRALYRIDRVTLGEGRLIEAARVEPAVYTPSDAADTPAGLRPFAAPVPVDAQFLDLPLLSGAEVAHAPHLAVSASPWPGSAAVFSSASDNGYQLNRLVERPAIMGVTQTVLTPARPGLLDRGAPLRVSVGGGSLSSAPLSDVLNGANTAAIGDGSSGNWEVFQFTDAVLVAEGVYDLTGRLRGQAGTDALAQASWPAGSAFVLLDAAVGQIELPEAARGLARHYRIGPAGRAFDDPSYVHLIEAFAGIGLRPLAPVHLRALADSSGDLQFSWIRRTRIDGDNWASVEVPLGEEAESYLVRVEQSGAVVRETTVAGPAWTYSAADKAADGLAGSYSVAVAQISTRFGPGLFRRMDLNE